MFFIFAVTILAAETKQLRTAEPVKDSEDYSYDGPTGLPPGG